MNSNLRINDIDKLDFSKYDLIKAEKLDDINSVGILLKHKKSGARIALITNDDKNKVFSIGFKTPPYNDTGLQHILEHSTLCGSRKYPVKDPFVELCKGSLNTFLNAMTYPDKTIYPVASCNDADFKNITDVYMDAVFYPNIYKNPEIFMQEGWHYELEEKDADIKYNGVVFNEMKGVYSSADDVLARHTFSTLFPDTAYRFESGGEPESIPNLTREEFLDYHKNYYHPVNSYIYLYGDFDVQERLDYLDSQYLCEFDKNDVNINSDIQLQKPFDKQIECEFPYAVTEDEPLENNTYISLNKIISTALDRKLYVAMQILDYTLISAPGAILKQALIDKGIGTDIYSNYETSAYQPMYSIIAKNADKSQKQLFIDTINEELENIVKNSINKRMVQAGINYYEFKYREADFGSYPKGLMYYLSMLDSWLYDDNEPFMHVKESEIFDELKRDLDNGYFEEVINKYFLNNNHGAVICLVPEYGLEVAREEKEAKVLADYKASLSDEQIEKLIEDTNKLKAYQDAPSSQEDLEKIPMLKLSDIDAKPEKLYIDKKEVAGAEVIHHNMFSNGIAYIDLAFDCKNVPDELFPYIGLLNSTLGLMDTEHFTYTELTNEININCGGISTDSSIYNVYRGDKENRTMYEVKGKVLYSKIPFVLDMMKEIIFTTKFNDYKRLKEIIARLKSRLESTMTSSGHTVAMLECLSQFSKTGYYSNEMRGYGFYKLIQKLDASFDSMKEEISDNLNKLIELIFTKNNLVVSITANDEGFDKFSVNLKNFIDTLKESDIEPAVRTFKPHNVKTGFTSSSQVQYVARCGNYLDDGFKYTGALKVLKVIMGYDYLWNNVRVKGGAYGCMSNFYRNGDCYMVSYRDPHLKETNEIYEAAADYIKNFTVSERDMVKFIIGTIGDMDTPLNPAAKGLRSFGAYLCKADYEDLVKERQEVLSANQESIRELSELVRNFVNQDYLCVVGNQNKINSESDMFDTIKPLFIS